MGVSINLAAARYVTSQATDPADARMLLDMLGLVDDAGRIAPDETRVLTVEVPLAAVNNREPSSVQWWTDKPEVSTAPEALRNLAPPQQFPRKVPTRPPLSTPNDTGACGEPRGYKRHQRRGEDACRPCKDAHNYERQILKLRKRSA
jgi:hypothetical protein